MEKEIKIIFEDKNILILDKWSGLVVNRSNTYKETTLQDILEKTYPELYLNVSDQEYLSRSGLVHRLDKDTSGIVAVAKNTDTFHYLLHQFKQRKTLKEYVAVVHGEIEDEIIEIDAPLARNPKAPLRIAVVSGGKPAFTKIEKMYSKNIDGNTYTLVRVFPKTGRTHQIRIHLSSIGHPVAGDKIYCASNLLENDNIVFSRLMLHAEILGFIDPENQKFHRFKSPLPNEFKI